MEKTEAQKHDGKEEIVKENIAAQTEKEEKKKAKDTPRAAKHKEIKHEAFVRGRDLPISTRHAIAICRFIKNKPIQQALSELEQAAKLKKAIPFRGEIPHRHGKGIASGRYPVRAAKQFIKLLKNLSANASINNLDVDSLTIAAKADLASRRRFSRKYSKFKRSNVLLVAREPVLKKAGNAGEKKK